MKKKNLIIILGIIIFINFIYINNCFATLAPLYKIEINLKNVDNEQYIVKFMEENKIIATSEKEDNINKEIDSSNNIIKYSFIEAGNLNINKIVIKYNNNKEKKYDIHLSEVKGENQYLYIYTCEYDMNTEEFKDTTKQTVSEINKEINKNIKNGYLREVSSDNLIIIFIFLLVFISIILITKKVGINIINLLEAIIITTANYILYPKFKYLALILIFIYAVHNIINLKKIGKFKYSTIILLVIQIILLALLNYYYEIYTIFHYMPIQ